MVNNTNNNSSYQLFVILFLLIALSSSYEKPGVAFGYTNTQVSESKVRCMEREREALVKFKQSLVDEYGVLSSWGSSGEDNKDCCQWWGVKCSNRTGHVTVLDLRLDQLASLYDRNLRGELSHSLTELKHLRYLDLSYNTLRGTQYGEIIASLHKLEYLSLRYVGFSGEVPHQIGNLTSLQTLDLGGNSRLAATNLEWLSQLGLLRTLDLSQVYLNVTDWLQVILSLPFLEELYLKGCWLPRAQSLPLHSTNSYSESLAILDLSFNELTSSSTYYWLFNVSKKLVSIDLSSNALEGPIPDALGEMVYLEHIDLAGNLLQGGLPKSFQNLTRLRSLSLAFNNLSESFLELQQKLSPGVEKSLESLSLDGNQFYGALTDLTSFSSLRELGIGDNQLNGSFLGNFVLPPNLLYLGLSENQITGNLLLRSSFESLGHSSGLEYLDLSNNQMSGLLPDLQVLSSLKELHLSNNKFRGNIPESLGQLSKLEVLDLSSNRLEGTLSEIHFSQLSNLKELDLSFNSLAMNMSSDWSPTFQLDVIKLANCSMRSHYFPQWLKTQNNFSDLDLSFGGISDALPNWFWDLSPKLEYLNLSYNQINGKLPELAHKFDGYPRIDLSSNNFSGPILSIPPNLTSLHLHKNMFLGSVSFLCVIMGDIFSSLDLSNNLFTGNLPDCWMNMQSLVILNLGNNNFSGPVPKSLGFLYQLQTLHLRNNSFVGELPASLKDCRQLKVIDVGGNHLTGNIPTWIGSDLTHLLILSLGSNKFHGSIPTGICNLSSAQILDLSNNNITGGIPRCFNNLTALVQKNSSSTSAMIDFEAFDGSYYPGGEYMVNVWVMWKRQESEYRKTLGYLKTIDLSCNKLVGQIPEEIASLRGLISLNLSANHLTGNIIEHIGEMEMLESLDLSRNQLSGVIPPGLTRLHYISVLDLSYNNLSGKIPTATQLQSFNASTYVGNSELCGPPLKQCPWDAVDTQPSVPDVQDEDDHQFITKGMYIPLGTGFVFGLWGVFVLLLKASWRNAYFRLLDGIGDWFYVMSRVYMGRLKRMLNG